MPLQNQDLYWTALLLRLVLLNILTSYQFSDGQKTTRFSLYTEMKRY